MIQIKDSRDILDTNLSLVQTDVSVDECNPNTFLESPTAGALYLIG